MISNSSGAAVLQCGPTQDIAPSTAGAPGAVDSCSTTGATASSPWAAVPTQRSASAPEAQEGGTHCERPAARRNKPLRVRKRRQSKLVVEAPIPDPKGAAGAIDSGAMGAQQKSSHPSCTMVLVGQKRKVSKNEKKEKKVSERCQKTKKDSDKKKKVSDKTFQKDVTKRKVPKRQREESSPSSSFQMDAPVRSKVSAASEVSISERTGQSHGGQNNCTQAKNGAPASKAKARKPTPKKNKYFHLSKTSTWSTTALSTQNDAVAVRPRWKQGEGLPFAGASSNPLAALAARAAELTGDRQAMTNANSDDDDDENSRQLEGQGWEKPDGAKMNGRQSNGVGGKSLGEHKPLSDHTSEAAAQDSRPEVRALKRAPRQLESLSAEEVGRCICTAGFGSIEATLLEDGVDGRAVGLWCVRTNHSKENNSAEYENSDAFLPQR
eukprot:SAG31_NODE_3382_length_4335_cov_2.871813_4_plen_437_part_00